MSPIQFAVGDTVLWRGSWGTDEPKPAIVIRIQITRPGEKYGLGALSACWETARQNRVVVDLDNGCWAYGTQLAPLVRS